MSQPPHNPLISVLLKLQELQHHLLHVRLLQKLCVLDRFLVELLLQFALRLGLLILSRISFQMHYLALMKLSWLWLRINLVELTSKLKAQYVLNTKLLSLFFRKSTDCRRSKALVQSVRKMKWQD
nr:putative nucleotide binding protein [Ipomoea batatas]